MATNRYFTQGSLSEQNLHEDIMIEALKIYGQDCVLSCLAMTRSMKITFSEQMFRRASIPHTRSKCIIENTSKAFDGEGDLFSKFGVEIRDQATSRCRSKALEAYG